MTWSVINLKNYRNHKLVHDVVIRPLTVHNDPRGTLTEVMKTTWKDDFDADHLPFSQSYISFTQFNVARDEDLFHYHPNGQQDRFIIIKGQAVILVYDDRPNSPTKGTLNLFQVDGFEKPENSYLVLVPPYCLHGFLTTAVDGTYLINFPSHLYDPKNEARLKFDDHPLPDGQIFNWSKVRKSLNLPVPDKPITK